jgi:hypothetical protein
VQVCFDSTRTPAFWCWQVLDVCVKTLTDCFFGCFLALVFFGHFIDGTQGDQSMKPTARELKMMLQRLLTVGQLLKQAQAQAQQPQTDVSTHNTLSNDKEQQHG